MQGKINPEWNGAYNSALCLRINDEINGKRVYTIDGLWDLDWIPGSGKSANKAKIISLLKKTKIVDIDVFDEMDSNISPNEIDLFDREHSA